MRFQCFLLGSLACLQLAELGICTWVFQVHQKTVQDLLRSWVHFQRIPRDHWNKPEKHSNVGTSQQKLSAPSACWGKRSEALQYNLPLTRNLPASSHFCYQIPWVENFDLQSQCWQARLCRCSKQQAHTINLGEKHMVQSYETKDPCIVKTRDPHRRWFTTRFFENNTVDHVIIQVQIRCQTRLKALSWMTGAMSILHVGKNVTTPQAWPHPPDIGKALTNYMIFQHLDSTIFAKFWII